MEDYRNLCCLHAASQRLVRVQTGRISDGPLFCNRTAASWSVRKQFIGVRCLVAPLILLQGRLEQSTLSPPSLLHIGMRLGKRPLPSPCTGQAMGSFPLHPPFWRYEWAGTSVPRFGYQIETKSWGWSGFPVTAITEKYREITGRNFQRKFEFKFFQDMVITI